MIISKRESNKDLLTLALGKPFSFDLKVFSCIMIFNIIFIISKLWILDKPILEESDFDVLSLNGIFLLLILAPVVEEFMFRGIFFFSKHRIRASLYMPVMIYFLYVFSKVNLDIGKAYILVFLILIGVLTYLFHLRFLGFIRENSLFMILLTGSFFAIAHIFNYPSFDLNSSLALVPRLLGGLFFGYVVIKYGLWASMRFHFANNLLVVAIAFVQKVLFWS